MELIQIVALVASLVSLAFAAFLAYKVVGKDEGNDQIRFIGKAIQDGAMAFLSREYRLLAIFVAIMAVILAVFVDLDVTGRIDKQSTSSIPVGTAIAYLVGAFGSGLAGFIGMSIAVRANTRTTVQAMQGLNPALRVAFNSGAVMGVTVVGIGILGVSILWWIFKDPNIIAGFDHLTHHPFFLFSHGFVEAA